MSFSLRKVYVRLRDHICHNHDILAQASTLSVLFWNTFRKKASQFEVSILVNPFHLGESFPCCSEVTSPVGKMLCCGCDGESDASGQRIARIQAQLKDHRRHLSYQVGDMLDDCQVMLADGHDQVMSAMINDLQDVVGRGCVREDMESDYQEQNDHPLTYLSYTLELSLPTTTTLACVDRDTLKELATKVARQQTRMKEAEASAQGSRQRDDCPRTVTPLQAEANHTSIMPGNGASDPYKTGTTDEFMDLSAEQTRRSVESCRRRTYLEVPDGERDIAKSYGAKWDPQRRKWFADSEFDLPALSKWQPRSFGSIKGDMQMFQVKPEPVATDPYDNWHQPDGECLEATQAEPPAPSEATTGYAMSTHSWLTLLLLPLVSALCSLNEVGRLAFPSRMAQKPTVTAHLAFVQRLRRMLSRHPTNSAGSHHSDQEPMQPESPPPNVASSSFGGNPVEFEPAAVDSNRDWY